jgi:hypothetical protein
MKVARYGLVLCRTHMRRRFKPWRLQRSLHPYRGPCDYRKRSMKVRALIEQSASKEKQGK